MAEARYALAGGTGTCVLEHPQHGTLRLPVIAISCVEAELDGTQTFQVNEYLDVTLELDGAEPAALFANVVASGGPIRLRWLHFDPAERGRLDARLVAFAKSRNLAGGPIPDEPPPAKRTERKGKGTERGDKTAKPTVEVSGTRRITRPRGEAPPAPAPAVDLGAIEGETSKKQTRRITRPGGATMPAGADDDHAFDDIFGGAEKKAPPPAPAERKHPTTTVVPFSDGGSSSRRPVVPVVPPAGHAEKRETRRVVRPQARPTPPAPTAAPTPPSPPVEESGKHVVIEPTDRFEKISSDVKPPAPASTEGGVTEPAKSGTRSVSRRLNIIGQDGKLDVGATIRNRAKTVSASELAARHKQVRVLNMGTIKALIQDAVEEAVQRLGRALDENERKKLLEEAEGEFQERLKSFQAEKKGLEERMKTLSEQFERAQRLLDEERAKTISADQFTVSTAGVEDLEKRVERVVNRAIKVNGVTGALADELREMVTHLLDEERERIAQQAMEAQSQAIALLEKKVSRLASTLEDAEKERDKHARRAQALESKGVVYAGNVMEAGLDEDDPQHEQKLELLQEVFKSNREMREALVKAGITIESKRKRPVAAQASAGAPTAVQAPAATEAAVPAAAPVAAEPAAPEASAAPAPESEPAGDPGVNPDDLPWEPGMSFSREVIDDGPRSVKELKAFKDIAPPPLQVVAAGSLPAIDEIAVSDDEDEGTDDDAAVDDAAPADAAGGGAETGDGADPYAGANPDDEVWVPDQAATDAAAEDDGAVKRMTSFKDFEPPPLEKKRGG